ncbi:MAG: acyl-CoA dehydrogenase family protein [Actinobacteria bacterium]|nr:acyl-CoA dehydrogenase family protein [Actinomycetota bacterium]
MSLPIHAGDFFALESSLSLPEQELVMNLRAYLETLRPDLDDLWEKAEFPRGLVKGLAEARIIGLSWEETRPFENSAEFRGWISLELSRVDASVATYVGVQAGLAMGSIGLCGSDEQRAEWLPKMAAGDVVGAFGLTEPTSGSDAALGLQTTAQRRGDEWAINGAKRWIGNATWSDICIIWARDLDDNKVKGFIVPTNTPGYQATKIERKISLRIVQNADIVLTDVVVPESLRLPGARSFSDTAAVLRATRAEVAWAAVGASIGAYEAALAYANSRTQFGKPIAAHQLVQDLLVKCMGNITSSLTLVREASRKQDSGDDRDEFAALAKAVATTRARETVAMAREVMGGNGIVLDYGAARFFADMEALYSYEGTREINTLIVGRALTGQSAFV